MSELIERLNRCAASCDIYSPDQCATLIDGIGHIAMRHLLREAAAALEAAREDAHPDDAAVDAFASAMKDKLAAARAKGRGGWNGDDPGMQQRLSDMLRAHVEKGDPRDVANFAMFLHQRGESILPAQQPAAREEMSPEFTDSARATIAWVLYHHQGGSSPVGQPLRFALGMGADEPLPDWRISEAKAWAEWARATTADFHRQQPAAVDEARPLSEWHEDDGPVTWWKLPVDEPAWIGTPLDGDWPGYHTHWTPHPDCPSNAGQQQDGQS